LVIERETKYGKGVVKPLRETRALQMEVVEVGDSVLWVAKESLEKSDNITNLSAKSLEQ
jgi:hypothetical protein